jgi:hypothetical protein
MFDYEPETGALRWKQRAELNPQWNGKWPGTVAGTPDVNGYIEVRINRKAYQAHRLIWKWLYGTEPPDIDHKNTRRDDNREHNLRECTHADNTRNTAGWSKKLLPKGVHLRPESGRYRAIICVDKKNIGLGTFGTVDEAAAAYAVAAEKFHGEFARTE